MVDRGGRDDVGVDALSSRRSARPRRADQIAPRSPVQTANRLGGQHPPRRAARCAAGRSPTTQAVPRHPDSALPPRGFGTIVPRVIRTRWEPRGYPAAKLDEAGRRNRHGRDGEAVETLRRGVGAQPESTARCHVIVFLDW